MISKISLKKVASYKDSSVLETDKRVNLIYGLNGTGKSILSNFLYSPTNPIYKHSSVDGLDDNHDILVYNETFIQDNFYESESLKGIFTLSKVNKEAEERIANAEKEIKRIYKEKETKEKELDEEQKNIIDKRKSAKNKIWKIKKDYTGGDRVLEFCLEGYKNDGNKLLSFVESLEKPKVKPQKSIEQLKQEVQSLSGENAQKYDLLSPISFTGQDIEKNSLFEKQIIGNENSSVSELINELRNSDWVKDGIKYLPSELNQEKKICPFCQEYTITEELIEGIKNYFDETFESDINKLKKLLERYSEAVNTIPEISVFESNPMYETVEKDFELKYNGFKQIVENNTKLIEDKIRTPSVPVTLKNSSQAFKDLNNIISDINKKVVEHNEKIDKRESEFKKLKAAFWDLMRWEYDHTINFLKTETKASQKKIDSLNNKIQDYKDEITKQNAEIIQQQKKTVNLEVAISNINNGLTDLGIEDFKIKHHSENLYKLVRGENDENIFESLSEGEKMVISFLYFLEQCRGKKNVAEAAKKKIVVIDDPISSLSHIYIFNIGRFIHSEFLRNDKYEQVFILTHSLYFFYELTDANHERRKENQKLFRLRKNSNGSKIIEMSYEEIQNDYHSYWFIIKDDQQPPSLIANCMRNVIEYFFNFVEKKDLNNVFQKPSLQENRFQAFCRYINRESHSLGQNIFDIKEFNYNDFKDAFALVFKETGYEAHYNKMMK